MERSEHRHEHEDAPATTAPFEPSTGERDDREDKHT
ncbi:hypothetical protein FB391_3648 [Microbacterium kyungheense]|uniref:Uncharacterized protein n=1 Tax=Microbacterium kyungheense TaxID=1263636 RepID=A0A543EE12_9MICO|nr:hypothetical protein FB391_3648 [Microbacterium kyungheense]